MIIDVVAAVIRDEEGRLLVAQRPAHARHGGQWEFPGGKLDPGETLAEAARRELEEELSLELVSAAAKPVFTADDPGHPFRIHFLPVAARGTPILHEHDAVAWVSIPAGNDYDLAPGDARFMEALATGEVRL